MDLPSRCEGETQDQAGSSASQDPSRHLRSNNWRVRNDAPSPASTGSSHRAPGRISGHFSGNSWRSGPEAGAGPAFGRQQNHGTNWRNQQTAAVTSPPSMVEHDDNTVRRRSPGRTASSQLAEGPDALSEGRRIYLGNILYHVRPEEIAEALEGQGFADIEQMHVSIDPVTGRNPGYCFVEFNTRGTAESVMQAMSGVRIKGRPLKTGPCQPKRTAERRPGGRRDDEAYKPTFDRWGNWKSGGNGVRLDGQGPVGAEEHLIDVVQDDQRCRVYVGGLGKMINQEQNDQELRDIFQNFKVAAVSKRITPHESTRALPGKHHYAFVDLVDRGEALAAIGALHGRLWRGTRLKVQMPSDLPQGIEERGTRYNAVSQDVPTL